MREEWLVSRGGQGDGTRLSGTCPHRGASGLRLILSHQPHPRYLRPELATPDPTADFRRTAHDPGFPALVLPASFVRNPIVNCYKCPPDHGRPPPSRPRRTKATPPRHRAIPGQEERPMTMNISLTPGLKRYAKGEGAQEPPAPAAQSSPPPPYSEQNKTSSERRI